MNDCLWYSIEICERPSCRNCKQYISTNSDKGQLLSEQWSNIAKETLVPLVKKFAEENGFKEVK